MLVPAAAAAVVLEAVVRMAAVRVLEAGEWVLAVGSQGSQRAVERQVGPAAALVEVAQLELELRLMSRQVMQVCAGQRAREGGATGRWHRRAEAPVVVAPLPLLGLS